jgi:integral membrane protein
MHFSFKTALDRFRTVAILEGISYLILLFIAMPLKYVGGIETAVKYPGMVHGVLFVVFGFLLLQVWIEYRWTFKKAAAAFLWSLVPFGTFYFDKKIAHDEPRS